MSALVVMDGAHDPSGVKRDTVLQRVRDKIRSGVDATWWDSRIKLLPIFGKGQSLMQDDMVLGSVFGFKVSWFQLTLLSKIIFYLIKFKPRLTKIKRARKITSAENIGTGEWITWQRLLQKAACIKSTNSTSLVTARP